MHQNLENEKNKNNPATHKDMKRILEDKQEGQEYVFGNWMIVKRNYRNRNPIKNQTNGVMGKKQFQLVTAQETSTPQKDLGASGSRFAIFETEDDYVEREPTIHDQMVSMEDATPDTVNNLLANGKNKMSLNE